MPEFAADDVARAALAVPRGHYVDHPRLGAVPQATAQAAIERDLRRANIQPRQTVLEIGTGTGLTGALIAGLTGPSGHVVSVDIDPALTSRAAELHAERGVRNITLVTGDGTQGAPGHGPFDMIMAWATPTVIPRAWLDQAKPGTVICTPVYVAETARTTAHVRATVTAGRSLAGITLGAASYVDMGAEINTNFNVPMFYIDATRDDGGHPAWISVAWRGRHPGHDPRRSLEILSAAGHREPGNSRRTRRDTGRHGATSAPTARPATAAPTSPATAPRTAATRSASPAAATQPFSPTPEPFSPAPRPRPPSPSSATASAAGTTPADPGSASSRPPGRAGTTA